MSVNETDDLTELRHWLVCLVVGSIALGLLVVLPYSWWLNVTPIEQLKGTLEDKDFFELQNQAIKSFFEPIQILATVSGGIAILFNVYYGAKRTKALEKNAIAATQNAIAATKNSEVAEQGQITERFTKAIEQLGSDNISIRLGGIYALERIAKDSERDHWAIMEVLSAFVRENAPLKEDLAVAEGEQQPQKLRTDIQAALSVIGRRNPEKDKGVLNLRSTDLRGANLSAAQLQGADFCEAKLQGAYLIKANLKEAQLVMANLEGAFIHQANLEQAKLLQAILRRAKLSEANLKKADLYNADLEFADLRKANLEGAKFDFAKLTGTQLSQANLRETSLIEAGLKGTNFSETDVELKQIEYAFGDSTTVLPNDVERPAHWM